MPKLNKIFTLDISPENFLISCSPLELKEIDTLIQSNFYQERMKSDVCKYCGCTEYNCKECIEKTGEPCYWFEPNVCSACAAEITTVKEIKI